MPTDTLQDRIQMRLDFLGLSASQASRLASEGKNGGLIRDIMRGKSKSPRGTTLQALAQALQCAPDWLSTGDGSADHGTRPMGMAEASVPFLHNMAPATLDQDIPVRGTTAGSDGDGAFQFENGGEAFDYVRRPPALAKARDVYALYIEGTSMMPRFEAGELIYVSAKRPVRIGDYVVLQIRKNALAPVTSYIKRLKKQSSSELVVEQFNPPIELRFDAKEVVSVHKVLTMNELFGA